MAVCEMLFFMDYNHCSGGLLCFSELHRRTSTQPITQMAVDWPCLENAADSNSLNCSQMDTRWKTGERKTERNLEKNGGARNERI